MELRKFFIVFFQPCFLCGLPICENSVEDKDMYIVQYFMRLNL